MGVCHKRLFLDKHAQFTQAILKCHQQVKFKRAMVLIVENDLKSKLPCNFIALVSIIRLLGKLFTRSMTIKFLDNVLSTFLKHDKQVTPIYRCSSSRQAGSKQIQCIN